MEAHSKFMKGVITSVKQFQSLQLHWPIYFAILQLLNWSLVNTADVDLLARLATSVRALAYATRFPMAADFRRFKSWASTVLCTGTRTCIRVVLSDECLHVNPIDFIFSFHIIAMDWNMFNQRAPFEHTTKITYYMTNDACDKSTREYSLCLSAALYNNNKNNYLRACTCL